MSNKRKHWPTIMLDCVLTGATEPIATAHLDDLLQWLSGTDSRGSRRLQKAFVTKPLSISRARRLSVEFLDRAFVSYHRNPWHMFGLAEAYPVKDDIIRLRYRRLIRVFHPDRGFGDPQWLQIRSERINTAYRELLEGFIKPTDTYNNQTGEFVDMSQFEGDFEEQSLADKLRGMVSGDRDRRNAANSTSSAV